MRGDERREQRRWERREVPGQAEPGLEQAPGDGPGQGPGQEADDGGRTWWARLVTTGAYRRPVAARRYLEAGWPVVPGAWWDGRTRRHLCPSPTCGTEGLHPWETGVRLGDLTPWTTTPASLLLPTGTLFDAVDADARRLAATPRRWAELLELGPALLQPGAHPRLVVLVPHGDERAAACARLTDALLHGPGSWVPLPPSRLRWGPVRWLSSPDVDGRTARLGTARRGVRGRSPEEGPLHPGPA